MHWDCRSPSTALSGQVSLLCVSSQTSEHQLHRCHDIAGCQSCSKFCDEQYTQWVSKEVHCFCDCASAWHGCRQFRPKEFRILVMHAVSFKCLPHPPVVMSVFSISQSLLTSSIFIVESWFPRWISYPCWHSKTRPCPSAHTVVFGSVVIAPLIMDFDCICSFGTTSF